MLIKQLAYTSYYGKITNWMMFLQFLRNTLEYEARMEKSTVLYKQNLLKQLASYELILQEKSDLLAEDRLLSEQILLKMWMIESQVNEMTMWEKIEDQTKSHHALDEANRILDALKKLIQQLLGDDDFNSGNSLPRLN